VWQDLPVSLDFSIHRTTLEAIDAWTRIGVAALFLCAAGLAWLLVRAEPNVTRGRRAAALGVGLSGAAALAALLIWWGGGWVVAPGGYGLETGAYVTRWLLLAGGLVVTAVAAFAGLAVLAIDDI